MPSSNPIQDTGLDPDVTVDRREHGYGPIHRRTEPAGEHRTRTQPASRQIIIDGKVFHAFDAEQLLEFASPWSQRATK